MWNHKHLNDIKWGEHMQIKGQRIKSCGTPHVDGRRFNVDGLAASEVVCGSGPGHQGQNTTRAVNDGWFPLMLWSCSGLWYSNTFNSILFWIAHNHKSLRLEGLYNLYSTSPSVFGSSTRGIHLLSHYLVHHCVWIPSLLSTSCHFVSLAALWAISIRLTAWKTGVYFTGPCFDYGDAHKLDRLMNSCSGCTDLQ